MQATMRPVLQCVRQRMAKTAQTSRQVVINAGAAFGALARYVARIGRVRHKRQEAGCKECKSLALKRCAL